MPCEMEPHINESTLEVYAMGRIQDENTRHNVQRHLKRCLRCREEADRLGREADLVAEAISCAPPIFRHDTSDGAITAHVGRFRDGAWVARLIGPKLDCGAQCVGEEEAQRWCGESFRSMFPEHRCGKSCYQQSGH